MGRLNLFGVSKRPHAAGSGSGPTHRQRILWAGPEGEISATERNRLAEAGHEVETLWITQSDGSKNPLRDPSYLAGFDSVVVAGDIRLYAQVVHIHEGRLVGRYYGEEEGLNLGIWNSVASQKMNRNTKAHFASAVDLSLCPGEPPWVTSRTTFAPQVLDPDHILRADTWSAKSDADFLVTRPSSEAGSTTSSRRIAALGDQYFSGPGYAALDVGQSGTEGAVVGAGATAVANYARLKAAPALLNLFSSSNVIPMAVLEMLMIGGPIVYFSGALNPLGLPPGGPGEVRTIKQAKTVLARLKSGDPSLVASFAAAQAGARARYDIKSAPQTYDREMAAILSGQRDLSGFHQGGGFRPEGQQASRLAYDILASLDTPGLGKGVAARRMVRTLYNLILQREPDQAGLEFHVARLQASRRFDRTVADLILSDEAKIKRTQNDFLAWVSEPAADGEIKHG